MIGVRARVDLSGVREQYKGIAKRGKNMRPVMDSLKAPLKADIRTTFRVKSGPEKTWPSRNPRSKVPGRGKKRRRGGRARLLGRLRSSFQIRASRSYVLARSAVSWSGVHQDGGKAGNDATIPQRMHLYASQELIDFAKQRMATYMAKGRIR